MDDQIITSERENLELMEKALTLSKQIIKQHEVKSQLLGERQKMLTNISQQFNLVPATKVPDCGQNNSVVQQSSGQSQAKTLYFLILGQINSIIWNDLFMLSSGADLGVRSTAESH